MKASRILIALIPLLIILSARSVSAQTNITVDTAFGYESEYVFRGVQLADHSFQSSVDIGSGGFYFGTWINAPIEDPNNSFLIEVDFYGGYGFDLNDSVSLDVGMTYYWYPEVPPASGTKEIYIGAAFDVTASPGVYIYYDFDLSAFTIEGSVGHSIALGDGPLSLDLGAYLAYATTDGGSNGVYYGTTIDVGYAISEHTSFSAGLRASGISDDIAPGTGRTSNFWWGMSFSSGF